MRTARHETHRHLRRPHPAAGPAGRRGRPAGRGAALPGFRPGPTQLSLDGPRDLAAAQEVVLEGENPQPGAVVLVLRIDDAQSASYATRFELERTVLPGRFRIRTAPGAWRTPSGRFLDAAAIRRIMVNTGYGAAPVRVTALRVETPVTLPADVAALSFGPDDAPVFPGFTRVPVKDPRIENGASPRVAIRRSSQQPLIGTGLRGVERFVLPWPNGRWDVSLWTEDPGDWEYLPHPRQRRVLINGAAPVWYLKTPEEWLRDVYFAGREAEDVTDPWTAFYGRRGGLLTQTVEVKDGRIVVEAGRQHDRGDLPFRHAGRARRHRPGGAEAGRGGAARALPRGLAGGGPARRDALRDAGDGPAAAGRRRAGGLAAGRRGAAATRHRPRHDRLAGRDGRGARAGYVAARHPHPAGTQRALAAGRAALGPLALHPAQPRGRAADPGSRAAARRDGADDAAPGLAAAAEHPGPGAGGRRSRPLRGPAGGREPRPAGHHAAGGRGAARILARSRPAGRHLPRLGALCGLVRGARPRRPARHGLRAADPARARPDRPLPGARHALAGRSQRHRRRPRLGAGGRIRPGPAGLYADQADGRAARHRHAAGADAAGRGRLRPARLGGTGLEHRR
ncbi:hypothetical protein [Dankookia sp. P2]|uniref:hypothetical protein n=1 Tax=Dankookia sp. P2 TaxID=3423955 RepID=UPI003D66E479